MSDITFASFAAIRVALAQAILDARHRGADHQRFADAYEELTQSFNAEPTVNDCALLTRQAT